MQRVKTLTLNLRENLLSILLSIAAFWIFAVLIIQITAITLEISGNSELLNEWSLKVHNKIDGSFKSSPENIWHNEDDYIWVESVTNNVKVGKLSGNRDLEFGVKNILEEYLQEKEYNLSPSSINKLKVEIVYLDVLTTKKNVSVFHKNEEEVVIRMKGIIYKDGKKHKEIIVEESSSEISMSTLIVDEGGQFNQTSLSNALKKSCDKLITKLME
jgi:hypothetical protein